MSDQIIDRKMILCIIDIGKFRDLFTDEKDKAVGLTTQQTNGQYSFLNYGEIVAYISSDGVPKIGPFCANNADKTSILLVDEYYPIDPVYNPKVPFKILYHTTGPFLSKVNSFEKLTNFCGKLQQQENPGTLYAKIIEFINLTGHPVIQFDEIWNEIPDDKENHRMNVAFSYIEALSKGNADNISIKEMREKLEKICGNIFTLQIKITFKDKNKETTWQGSVCDAEKEILGENNLLNEKRSSLYDKVRDVICTHIFPLPEYTTLFTDLCRAAIIAHSQDNNHDLIEVLKRLGWPQFINTNIGKQLNDDLISAGRKDLVLQSTWWREILDQNYESIRKSVLYYVKFNQDDSSCFLKMMDSIIQNKRMDIGLILYVYKSICKSLNICYMTKHHLHNAVHCFLYPWLLNIPNPNILQACYAPWGNRQRMNSPWLTTKWIKTKSILTNAIKDFINSYSLFDSGNNILFKKVNGNAHAWWISLNEQLFEFNVQMSSNMINEIDMIISTFNSKRSFEENDFKTLFSSLKKNGNVLYQYLHKLNRISGYNFNSILVG